VCDKGWQTLHEQEGLRLANFFPLLGIKERAFFSASFVIFEEAFPDLVCRQRIGGSREVA
jgi:hypothetical protein